MESSNKPLVSVIIPAYNHERFVEQSIRSVWEQTYPNVELIILDDGSTDSTPEIIEGLLQQSPIPMKFVHKDNEGICKTLNKGLEMSSGEFISVLASDDMMLSDKLVRQLTYLKKVDKTVGGCCGDIESIDEYGNSCGLSTPYKNGEISFLSMILLKSNCLFLTTCIRSEVFEKVGKFDESLEFEDWDILLRILKEYKIKYLPGIVCLRRDLAGSLGARFREYEADIFKVLEKHKDHEEVQRYGYKRLEASTWLTLSQWSFTRLFIKDARKYALKSLLTWPFSFRAYYFFSRTFLSIRFINAFRDIKRRYRENHFQAP